MWLFCYTCYSVSKEKKGQFLQKKGQTTLFPLRTQLRWQHLHLSQHLANYSQQLLLINVAFYAWMSTCIFARLPFPENAAQLMLLLTCEVVVHRCTSWFCTKQLFREVYGFMKVVSTSSVPTGTSIHSSHNKLCYMKVCYKTCLRVSSVI